jgi:hypothetical protein
MDIGSSSFGALGLLDNPNEVFNGVLPFSKPCSEVGAIQQPFSPNSVGSCDLSEAPTSTPAPSTSSTANITLAKPNSSSPGRGQPKFSTAVTVGDQSSFGGKAKKLADKKKPYDSNSKDKSLYTPTSFLDTSINDIGGVCNFDYTQSVSVPVIGSGDCDEPVKSGSGAESSSPVSQDPLGFVPSLGLVLQSADPPSSSLLSEAEVLSLFQATLSYDAELPAPVVNFDVDTVISNLTTPKPESAMGGKLKKLRKKKIKKLSSLPTVNEEVFSDDDLLLEALKDSNCSAGDIARRFGRNAPRIPNKCS